MKKIILFAALWFFTEGVLAQIPEPIDRIPSLPSTIIGGAGFIKFDGGNPNSIAKIQSIDERYTAAFAWDTTINKLWQYLRSRPVGRRWTPTQFVQYANSSAVLRYDTSYKFIVDTTNRQLYVCNQSGCVNVTGGSATAVTASSGLNIQNNDIKLGGVLTQSATLYTSLQAPFKLHGLASGSIFGDSLLVINGVTGVVRRLNSADIQKPTHQLQKIIYSSGFSFDPNTNSLVAPSPINIAVQSNTSLVQFEDTNTNIFGASDMTITLPVTPSVWNRSIRLIPAIQTATYFSEPYMFGKLTFAAPPGAAILNKAIYTNVKYNTVFECQYISDTQQWFIIQIN